MERETAMLFSLLYFLTLILASVIGAPILYPASIVELERFVEHEETSYGIIKRCQEECSVRLEETGLHTTEGCFFGINQYVEDYETSSLKHVDPALFSVAGVPENPLASLRMLDRVVTLLKPLFISRAPCPEFADYVTSTNQTLRWPNEYDVEENIVRILRLQQIYNLPAKDLAQGLIGSTPTGIGLSSWQKYEMGLLAAWFRFYTLACEWLELTLKGLNGSEHETGMEERVRRALTNAMEEHDQSWNSSMSIGMQYHFHRKLIPSHWNSLPKITWREVLNKEANASDVDVKFWKLCSGERLKSPEQLSRLYCWLESKVHPFLTLAPLKLELLSSRPDIIRVYEIIGINLTNKIIRTALPRMEESQVTGPEGPEDYELSEDRTSFQAWLDDVASEEFRIVSKKVEMVTGLKVATSTSSEQLQVLAYSFGGHFGPHVDCLENNAREDQGGDRLATFMYYLSDVEAGGFTAFPTAGVAAEPIQGSAIFWFNLHNDGSCDDPGTLHGGCPVLLGRKYAATKWVLYSDQFKDWKCGLKQKQMVQFKKLTHNSGYIVH